RLAPGETFMDRVVEAVSRQRPRAVFILPPLGMATKLSPESQHPQGTDLPFALTEALFRNLSPTDTDVHEVAQGPEILIFLLPTSYLLRQRSATLRPPVPSRRSTTITDCMEGQSSGSGILVTGFALIAVQKAPGQLRFFRIEEPP